MSNLGKGLTDCLSGQHGEDLINIKFFRGSNEELTKEELLAEVSGVIERRVAGKVTPKAMPLWRVGKVDLHARVAKM